MIVRIGGIRKFTFDISNKNGTTHREFRRDQVEFVRLQSLRKMTGEGIGKRGRLALVFNLRVIIVCRRLSTTYGKVAVKGNLALGLGGEVQGIIHIELILKDQRKRENFIGQEERENTFPTKKPPCAQQESLCARRLNDWIARKGGLGRRCSYWETDSFFLKVTLRLRSFERKASKLFHMVFL